MDHTQALLVAILFLKTRVDPEQLPLVKGRITSEYGVRADPVEGTSRFHHGIDIALRYGSAVRAVADGQVVFAGSFASYGTLVTVRHGGGVSTLYAHCAAVGVRVGDRVSKGSVLGWVGSTGRSTGPHLHFEVRVKGQAVNPLKVLLAVCGTTKAGRGRVFMQGVS